MYIYIIIKIEYIYICRILKLLMEDIEDIMTSNLVINQVYRYADKEIYEKYLYSLLEYSKDYINSHMFKKKQRELNKLYKINPSIVSLNHAYYGLIENKKIKRNLIFEKFNIGKICRTSSGITQVTVLSSPYPNGVKFSCEHNCYYCPDEPAHEGNNFTPQPRSYLFHEPAVRRANENDFDGAKQIWNRLSTLYLCGLNIDKLEVMVLGGTWGSYPEDYRYTFIRDLYYAANTFYISNEKRRNRLSLIEEQYINETAKVKVIGLTLETRPDHVTARELELLNFYNCTRVQIGIQHTDDKILKKINRGCYYKDSIRAIKNLLNCGFKVDIHIMFDLPYASPYDDISMIDRLIEDENMRFDQAKLYPFASLDWTVTKKWEDQGHKLHYSADELMDVIIYAKSNMKPWVRLNRVIRDIPEHYIKDGNKTSNLRQTVQEEMKSRSLQCKCIRCREVKNKVEALDAMKTMKMFIRNYKASGGDEYFISYESLDEKYIYGFIRLRLSRDIGYVNDIKPYIKRKTKFDKIENKINVFPFLNDHAIIRELHVYGNMTTVNKSGNHTQHRGLGKKLLEKAEEIAYNHNYNYIAVISGVGVRKYYKKKGYYKYNNYMLKKLKKNYIVKISGILFFIFIFIIYYI